MPSRSNIAAVANASNSTSVVRNTARRAPNLRADAHAHAKRLRHGVKEPALPVVGPRQIAFGFRLLRLCLRTTSPNTCHDGPSKEVAQLL